MYYGGRLVIRDGLHGHVAGDVLISKDITIFREVRKGLTFPVNDHHVM